MTSKISNILLIVLVGLACMLPHLKLFEPTLMELRNFISAREMIDSGNWLLPTLNGEYRFEKPPLPTWLTAFFGLINPKLPWSLMRLSSVFIAVLLNVYIYFYGLLIFKNERIAFFTGLVAATSILIIDLGRTNSWDIYATAFMLPAIYHLHHAFNFKKFQFTNYLLFGLFASASIMSKGPVGPFAMLLPFLIGYFVYRRKIMVNMNWLGVVSSLLVILVLGLSWYFYVYVSQTDNALYVASKEVNSWSERQVKPFYFYGHFFLYVGVWVIVLFMSFGMNWARKIYPEIQKYQFLLLWLILALVFISVVPQKKERYLIPIIPPLALLIGSFIFYLFEQKNMNSLRRFAQITYQSIAVLLGLLVMVLGFVNFMEIGPVNNGYSSLGIAAGGGLIYAALAYINESAVIRNGVLSTLLVAIFAIPWIPYFHEDDLEYLPTYQAGFMQNEEMTNLAYFANEFPVNPALVWHSKKQITSLEKAEVLPDSILVFSLTTRSSLVDVEMFSSYNFQLIETIIADKRSKKYPYNVWLATKN